MMGIRGNATGVALVLVALVVTGCAEVGGDSSPGDVEVRVSPGVPADLSTDMADASLAVGWIEPGRTFAVVTLGSSSCYPVAKSLVPQGAGRIALVFDHSPNELCTADIAPTTHEFGLPRETSASPVTIEVSFVGSTESHEFVLE